ncbi:hypothetical protein SAMN05661080_01862 [Modestobacter sp. DSM 44400]|uniref:GNAT family N-acetyltransferase n=1 Tax=Modestobacter sp. DSM 44400 TaxID=1550230 RepID=UPI0008941C73|nr:GNAT family N-acetyltransferase [Modestobacter sp. DSM 44400]SDX96058.1 hypothetical protein SAMN05661080_01862 [Modestobacter sp. DSM 44400]
MAAEAAVRGRGHGAAVRAALHRAAVDAGQRSVELHARVAARRLYERAGYTAVGGEYEEAGITHMTMVRALGAGDSGAGPATDVTDRSAVAETRRVRPSE